MACILASSSGDILLIISDAIFIISGLIILPGLVLTLHKARCGGAGGGGWDGVQGRRWSGPGLIGGLSQQWQQRSHLR
jgi:hypothetical protein